MNEEMQNSSSTYEQLVEKWRHYWAEINLIYTQTWDCNQQHWLQTNLINSF